MLASAYGHTYVMKELVRRGANLNLLSVSDFNMNTAQTQCLLQPG